MCVEGGVAGEEVFQDVCKYFHLFSERCHQELVLGGILSYCSGEIFDVLVQFTEIVELSVDVLI